MNKQYKESFIAAVREFCQNEEKWPETKWYKKLNKALALALEEAKKLGIIEVLITCDEYNIASQKAILKNGGKFERTTTEPNNPVPVCRYFIQIDQPAPNVNPQMASPLQPRY